MIYKEDRHAIGSATIGAKVPINENYMAGAHGARGIRFRGIATYHYDTHGALRGKNTVFVIEAKCHAGDLGHILSEEQAVGRYSA